MSEPDDQERRRRRDYRAVARLMKEYTIRLYAIATRLGDYYDGGYKPAHDGTPPWPVYRDIERLVAIYRETSKLNLFASQMVLHYDLTEGEATELRVRLRDSEQAAGFAKRVAEIVARDQKIEVDMSAMEIPKSSPRPKTIRKA